MTQPSSYLEAYPAPGEIVDGKYKIERLIGEGGMGAVAKAMHLVRRAPVALKFMSSSILAMPGTVERFINEAVAASAIESDHIVRIFDTGTLPSGAPYLVMEYLEGVDLATIIERDGPKGIPVPRAIHFTLQVLRALQLAHAAGIVHRDMKPANCFVVTKDGEPDFVKLLDFGISKVRKPGESSVTQTNAALGTPLYMSPEQARSPRDVDLRTDLYSTGVILYELLTGSTPLNPHGEVTEVLFKLFTTDVPPIDSRRDDLPEGLAEAVHRALRREPDARVSSAAEWAVALAPWADARSASVIAKITAGGTTPTPSTLVSAGESASPAMPPALRSSATRPPPGGAPSSTGARTLSDPAPAVGKPATVRTDLGAARDQVDPSSGGEGTRANARAMRTAIGAGAAFAVLAVVGGVLALRFMPSPAARREATSAPSVTASESAPAAAMQAPPASATASAGVATALPPSTASATASATARTPVATRKPDAGAAATPAAKTPEGIGAFN